MKPTSLLWTAFLLVPACRTDSAQEPRTHASSSSTAAGVDVTAVSVMPAVPAAPIVAQERTGTEPNAPAGSREARLEAILADYDAARKAYSALFKDAKTTEERAAIRATAEPVDLAAFVARMRAIVDEDPRDEVALDAILWLLSTGRRLADVPELLARIEAHHMSSEKLATQCKPLAVDADPRGRAIVEKLLLESPHAAVRGHACFALAQADLRDVEIAQLLREHGDAEGFEYRGEPMSAQEVARLEALDVDATQKRAEALLDRVVSDFPDVASGKRTLGPLAQAQLFEIRTLAVGMIAPDIEGEDLDGTPFKLSDYRGKVVMLDFWGHW